VSAGVAGVVLAAGLSRRMGRDKLLIEVDGAPMVRRVVEAALSGGLRPVVVVVGPEAAGVRSALSGLPVSFAVNDTPEDGLGSSLRAGIDALVGREGDAPADAGARADGAAILLGDMPWVEPAHVEALVGAFHPNGGPDVCVPVHAGRRGNPVLWGRRYFEELQAIDGDRGARALLNLHADRVCEVGVDGDGVLRDVDTPEALEAPPAVS